MPAEKYYPTDPLGTLDAGASARRPRFVACARRLAGAPELTAWCVRQDGHDGQCQGQPSVAPPRQAFMPKGAK